MDRGSIDIWDLASLIEAHPEVDARLVLARVADGWQVSHGEVTVDAATPATERTWRYPNTIFVERRVPGRVIGGLIRKEPQTIDDLTVFGPPAQGSAGFTRQPGSTRWRHGIAPWPRTEWEVAPADPATRPGGMLIGDGPAFVTYEAALSAFLYATPPVEATPPQLWRIVQLDRRAWLHRVVVGADALTAVIRGSDLAGVSLELTTPTSHLSRPVGRTGKLKLRLPAGLCPGSLLLLRRDSEWLDFRYFPQPVPMGERDPSIVWDQPDALLAVLVAGGEGPGVEFRQEVPRREQAKARLLRTVAAFASGDGGTVLFGVDTDAQTVGLDPATLDRKMIAIDDMIRHSIEPAPGYVLRTGELDGRTLLSVDIAGAGRWHAVNPQRPEFYVRRGASTVPARLGDIAAGFS